MFLHFSASDSQPLTSLGPLASPSLDLELAANLTCVSRMRQDYYSTIFEYEIIC